MFASHVSTVDDIQEHWAALPLDHFNPLDQRTWQGHWLSNDKFYDPSKTGKSIVLVQFGGEGPMRSSVLTEKFHSYEQARELGALLLAFEHRYYGQSVPVPNLDTPNMRWLSADQALFDYAQLTTVARAELGLPEDSLFVAIGGSYSGNLSAWARERYPHIWAAAISSSAPIQPKDDFFEYGVVMADALDEVAPGCNQWIYDGIAAVDALLITATGRRQLSALFGTCTPVSTDVMDQLAFSENISDSVAGVIQYSHGSDIADLCDLVMAYPDPLSGVAAMTREINLASDDDCLPATYMALNSGLFNTTNVADAAERSWTAQTCLEAYGYWQDGTATQVTPYSRSLTVDFFHQMCLDAFEVPFNAAGIDRVAVDFGGQTGYAGTNVYFTKGTHDQWNVLGYAPAPEHESELRPWRLCAGSSHCRDLYQEQDDDVADIKLARQEQMAHLKQWLF
eukprot:gnl/Ergobibamus_cyprinoides/351.p1 GENE.gnl/Ergobibamus_cyprinoides/351~~gnl/Ergobibamus_cyprinoides/351.p1  ORF type:complete len:491 (+),score=192.07 gnl/Ergobibamus_cyprinoides/351:118-1473(+)